VAEAVTEARTRIDRREPAAGRAALAPALVREDLCRFRIPCASCGRGTIGVEETAEIDGLR
jgi:hypothetical protein